MSWILLYLACGGAAPEPAPALESAPEVAVSELGPPPLAVVERALGGGGGPLIVAMHGRGDAPERFARLFDPWEGPGRLLLPQAPFAYGPGWSWFTVSVRDGDEAALAASMRDAAERVEAMILARRARGEKPVVVGFSQGGMLAATLAVTAPEHIAGAVAVGGWLPRSLWPEAAVEGMPPLSFFHGEADTVLPLGPTREAVAHLQGLGAPVDLKTWSEVGHAIPRDMQAAVLARARELASP
ncbi:MAG: alpha/beta fold hydrolase [Alphaproteobacteria bacterium]|nr:alpha/beta fold hydrolase [Alphaproteobacteria bacterium]